MQKPRKLYTGYEYTKIMKAPRFHIYVIGVLLLNFYASAGHAQLSEQTKFTGDNTMVIVEPTNIITTEVDGDYSLEAYRERRGKWGVQVGLGYSTYSPENYEPNFLQAGFKDVYSFAYTPMIEFSFGLKRNLRPISLGMEVGVGIYQASSGDKRIVDSDLQLIPVRLSFTAMMDSLSPTPYFVPYLSAGGYIMSYKEDNNSSSVSGNTQVAPYLSGGMAFSLDWIDKRAARLSYEDSGIEATYAFVEVRSMMEGGDDQDPDFSSQICFAGGLKVEF